MSGSRLRLLLSVLALFSANFHAIQTQQLNNSCGEIHNITFPFKLNPESDICSDQNYTLSCENNRTTLLLYSGKYNVKAINYNDKTIRLADVGLERSNGVCSSFPFHSLSTSNFTFEDPYNPWFASLIVFLNCETLVKSPKYVNRTTDCSNGFYSYVLQGNLRAWDVADSCSVETMAISSSPLLGGIRENLSFAEMQRELDYGFELLWAFKNCNACKRRASCFGDGINVTAVCSGLCSFEPSFQSKFWRTIRDQGYALLAILGAVFCLRIFCVPCAFGFLIYKFRRRHLSMFDGIEVFLRNQNNLMPIRYSYSDIKKMTKGFRDKLGEGGYGSVYKGKLRSGQFVAVKMLSKPKSDGQEFTNEVATIGTIHHVNVVRLIGFSAERSKRALVYEFMPNGSLEKYIFSHDKSYSLSCNRMYEISLGVARGIEYLHQGCDMQILHFDIKPHNILLDENFTPKVSDFGLAKLYPTDDSIVPLTAARGTMGYMAPELFYKNLGGVSYKADVYSFGMLLMELAGRRRNWNSSANSSQIFFPSWVYEQFSEGKEVEMGEKSEEERKKVKMMMIMALWCIQVKPIDRPSMSKVVAMLEGKIEFLQMPPKPFLYPQGLPADNPVNEINPLELPNSSGACLDAITLDIIPR